MKRKSFSLLLITIFAALMVLVLFVDELPGAFSSVMAFPFEQLGAALGSLSRTGNLGNGLAWALAAALAVLPVLFAPGRGKGYLGEHIALGAACVVLFITLLGMANPSKLLSAFPALTREALPVVKSVLGCTAWSFLVLWFTLRTVRLFRSGDMGRLLTYLRVALHGLCILFVAVIAVSCGGTLVDGLTAGSLVDKGVAALRFLATALPYLLDIAITRSLLTLMDAYTAKDEEATAQCAGLLSRQCCYALGLTASSTAILNVVQLLLARFLTDVAVTVEIPLVSLAFLLLILIVSRLVVENRKLQNDNDLFI